MKKVCPDYENFSELRINEPGKWWQIIAEVRKFNGCNLAIIADTIIALSGELSFERIFTIVCVSLLGVISTFTSYYYAPYSKETTESPLKPGNATRN